jgi:exosortase O
MSATPAAFTAGERGFLGLNGADVTGKWRFTWRHAAGSFLVVGARSWRAHHPPEQCLAGAGLDLAGIGTELIDPDFPVRVVAVAGQGPRASYWFQALDRKTDDHAARVFDGLRREREWLMISVLLDDPKALNPADWRELHRQLAHAGDTLLRQSGG